MAGSTASEASTATAITTTLLTVPNPGLCRNGIHNASTTTPVNAAMVPKLRGTCVLTPWWNTSHGSSPRLASIIIAMDAPYSHSPTYNAIRRVESSRIRADVTSRMSPVSTELVAVRISSSDPVDLKWHPARPTARTWRSPSVNSVPLR